MLIDTPRTPEILRATLICQCNSACPTGFCKQKLFGPTHNTKDVGDSGARLVDHVGNNELRICRFIRFVTVRSRRVFQLVIVHWMLCYSFFEILTLANTDFKYVGLYRGSVQRFLFLVARFRCYS